MKTCNLLSTKSPSVEICKGDRQKKCKQAFGKAVRPRQEQEYLEPGGQGMVGALLGRMGRGTCRAWGGALAGHGLLKFPGSAHPWPLQVHLLGQPALCRWSLRLLTHCRVVAWSCLQPPSWGSALLVIGGLWPRGCVSPLATALGWVPLHSLVSSALAFLCQPPG